MTPRTRQSAPVRRVLLRLPAGLHERLTAVGKNAGLSFNEVCIRQLERTTPEPLATSASTRVRQRVEEIFGDRLVGLVAMGSNVRGDAGPTSDLDVLVVLTDEEPVTRATYGEWDARGAVEIGGRHVDAHFVVLPPVIQPTALWCEAAVEGDVWFDRDGSVGARLRALRRRIANGEVVRAHSHGQPYWKGAA